MLSRNFLHGILSVAMALVPWIFVYAIGINEFIDSEQSKWYLRYFILIIFFTGGIGVMVPGICSLAGFVHPDEYEPNYILGRAKHSIMVWASFLPFITAISLYVYGKLESNSLKLLFMFFNLYVVVQLFLNIKKVLTSS